MAEMSTPSPVSDLEKARAEAKAKLAKEKEAAKTKKEAPQKDGRTDAQLTKDIAASLRGIFEVIRYAAKMFGRREIEPLTTEEASEGAIYWVPLARRYYFIAQLTLYIGAPIWLLTTLSGKWNAGKKLEPKPPVKEKEKK